MLKQEIINFINENQNILNDASDKIWDLAEIKFSVEKSSEILCDILAKEGFTIEKGICGMSNAFVATIGSGKPVVGLLAEYDALPGMSQVADSHEKKASCSSENGHGCGHNALGVGSVAAGIALASLIKQNKLNATIKVFGTPAEEIGYGKAYMAKEGAFDNLDCIMTWHPMSAPGVWGFSTLAVNQLYFEFKGVSSHAGAAPELGRSALDAAEIMNIGTQFLREHIIDSARVHYAFLDVGGTAANVVQPTAKLHYFVRAPKQKDANEITDRIIKIANGAAMMTETEVKVTWDAAAAEYIVNQTMGNVMYENLSQVVPTYSKEAYEYAKPFFDGQADLVKVGLEGRFRAMFPNASEEEIKKMASSPISDVLAPCSYPSAPMTASTDVGDASWFAPTGQIVLPYGCNGSGPHSWQWVAMGKSEIAHTAVTTAGKVIAMSAVDLIQNPELLNKAKEEHIKNLNGQTYKSVMPDYCKPEI